jgi:ribosome-associated protein
MDIKKLQALVIDALEDVKAQDINVYDTTHLTSLFDRVAIASGTSNRQTKALAASVRDKVKENGGHILSIEGEDIGEWVLVDLGDMIVHIMQPAIRAYYRLEEIWGDKEVKFGAAKRISKRTASEPMPEPTPAKKPPQHRAASQTTLDDDKPKKPARKTTAAPKKTAVKTPKIPVGKKVKVAATKSTPKKSATKSTSSPAKRAPAKRATKAKTAE